MNKGSSEKAVTCPMLASDRYSLPLDKSVWVDTLEQVASNSSRNVNAAALLSNMGWDLSDQIKVLEGQYEKRNEVRQSKTELGRRLSEIPIGDGGSLAIIKD